MLIKYINKAMSKAVYDKLDDTSYSGKIPQCPGVIAFGESLYQCQQELESSLEGWLIVRIRHGDKLPVLDRIDLNKRMPSLKEVVAHA
ncbi:MAG: type II toxin-antitoxin system HicB family antitoxin [Deltaproteobacteria bacterium]|nr:type II toxin-antitoxin system HicB family antitoxin [Deltaproteobacteria bacterium]MBW1939738.1 type II toxin-antitoxin system HicB family antitoxin [Deltaproteobacteria bacterium]MBW1965753.1 type II toxin-antitoxin system HicB family antitoxin [Deltaproteobacteria bacterium]MBW2351371.1 type II toxin-antitoxin system HicB family antitoxin [Deltaproteobacteria bacterium]